MTFLSASSLASVSKVLRNEWSSWNRDGSWNATKQLSLPLCLDLEAQAHLESTVLRSFDRRSANRKSTAARSVELLFLFNLGTTWPPGAEGTTATAWSGQSSSESTPTSGMTILPWPTMEHNSAYIALLNFLVCYDPRKNSCVTGQQDTSSNNNPCCTVLWALKLNKNDNIHIES